MSTLQWSRRSCRSSRPLRRASHASLLGSWLAHRRGRRPDILTGDTRTGDRGQVTILVSLWRVPVLAAVPSLALTGPGGGWSLVRCHPPASHCRTQELTRYGLNKKSEFFLYKYLQYTIYNNPTPLDETHACAAFLTCDEFIELTMF